jgi:hypothetical protein
LSCHDIIVHPITLETRRGGQRGGVKNYEVVRNHINRTLRSDSATFVTTMIDLYALPTTFPGCTETGDISDAQQRVLKLEEAFGKDIGEDRFLPYLQLYEFEALLFSDVDTICRIVQPDSSNRAASRALKQIKASYPDPEAIDYGDPPSKRLEGQFGAQYRKALFSPLIASQIGIDAIRQECRHFDSWIRRLETLFD